MENTVNILFAPHDKTTNMFFPPDFSVRNTRVREKNPTFLPKNIDTKGREN